MPQKAKNVRNMPAKYQIYICYSTEIPRFQSSVLPPIPLIKKKCQFFRRFSIVRRWALNPSLGAKTAVPIENTPVFLRFRGQISKKKRPNFVEIILERNTKMRSDVRRMRGFSDRHTDEG